jgi:two-component system response regulator HydG
VSPPVRIPLDVRVIAASNRDLHASMRAGEFREDLFYRINVIEIGVPPLRERGRDELLCAQHFIHEFASHMHKNVDGLSLPAAERLLAYSWPGNVRELRNTIERAVALTRHARIVISPTPEQEMTFLECAGAHAGGRHPSPVRPRQVMKRDRARHGGSRHGRCWASTLRSRIRRRFFRTPTSSTTHPPSVHMAELASAAPSAGGLRCSQAVASS